MSRMRQMPNPENCSLVELHPAAQAAVSKRSHVRMMAIKALLLGVSRDHVSKLYGITPRALSSWVNKFNRQGIDGLIEQARSGRPPRISLEKTDQWGIDQTS